MLARDDTGAYDELTCEKNLDSDTGLQEIGNLCQRNKVSQMRYSVRPVSRQRLFSKRLHTTTGRSRAPVTLDDFPIRELLLDDLGQEDFIEVASDEVECRLGLGGEDDGGGLGWLGGHGGDGRDEGWRMEGCEAVK